MEPMLLLWGTYAPRHGNHKEALMTTVNEQLVAMLGAAQAKFRIVDHPNAGKSEEVAKIRGTENRQGAKAMVCSVKHFDGNGSLVLAILPGHKRLDFSLLASAIGAKKATIADRDIAMSVTGCEIGAIPPFSFNPVLRLVVDPSLLQENEEIAFNAGRLDQSVIMSATDYQRIAQPEQHPISKD